MTESGSDATRVAIVIPCYNGGSYIGETLASIENQTFTNWECVIVDDGSTDASAEVAAEFTKRDERFRLYRQPNGGMSFSRNRGYREVSPDCTAVLFFDADDVLDPAMIETLAGYLAAHPEVGAAYCRRRYIDQDGAPIRTDWTKSDRWQPWGPLIRRMPDTQADTPLSAIFANCAMMIPSCTLMRRSLYDQGPGWDTNFAPAEDIDLFSYLSLQAPIHFVPKVLVQYRIHGNQTSGNMASAIKKLGEFEKKWQTRTDLPPEHRRRANEAAKFRQRWHALIPFVWSMEALVRGRPKDAAGLFYRAVRDNLGRLRSR